MRDFESGKQVILKLMKDPLYVPMKEKELVVMLQVSKEDRDVFKECLNALLSEGQIECSKRGKYALMQHKYTEGIFSATQHGYGFVTVDGETDDYFISEKDVNTAMHGDTVSIEPYSKSHRESSHYGVKYRKEAYVVSVIKRATDIVVGTFDKANHNYGFVIPDNNKITQDIFIAGEFTKGAVSGHKVVVKLTDFGGPHKSPEGKIIEILGHIGDPGVDILSIIKAYGLATDFPERVMNQAEKVPDELTDIDYNNREDLRDELMVTIDGEDAKDLDDAVSLRMEDDHFVLGVHIADVTHYVKEGSAIDKEARERGTSVYLADRVIPMLPQRLCNGICSLNEQVDRLAMSCIMTFSSDGKLLDHKICESVIRTNHRMNYSDVNAIIESHDTSLCEKYADVTDMLFAMKKLADILRARRNKRGSIDFDLPETKLVLDENGHPLDIMPYERNSATKLIEDFMLAANETIAEHFYWLQMPFVYRVHEKPDADKIKKLSIFVRNFGYGIKVKDDEVHPKELQKLLDNISDTPQEALLSRLTLRSMQRAKYDTECKGHFGLACEYYCHFTSPIRRYPDLQIHRIIKDWLHGRLKDGRISHYEEILDTVAQHSGVKERSADDAEREVDKLKKAEYMGEHIGEIFEGVISGVTNWGLYVELPNTVEGLVHISKISGDYYVYREETYELIGEATGKRFALGDRISVCVNAVDLGMRTVDFVLAEDAVYDRSMLDTDIY